MSKNPLNELAIHENMYLHSTMVINANVCTHARQASAEISWTLYCTDIYCALPAISQWNWEYPLLDFAIRESLRLFISQRPAYRNMNSEARNMTVRGKKQLIILIVFVVSLLDWLTFEFISKMAPILVTARIVCSSKEARRTVRYPTSPPLPRSITQSDHLTFPRS